MASYQDWVLSDYAMSPVAHIMSINEYVELVTKNQPSVTSDDDIYEPIPVNVQLCGMQAVPVQIDYSSTWYERLCDAVGSMCRVPGAEIELKDIRGQCISDASASRLECIGKIKAYARGKRINLSRLPAPPQHLSNNKMQTLCSWIDNDIHGPLVSTIANHLVGATSKLDLQPRTAVSSNLGKAIAKVITDNCIGGDATQFMLNFGSNGRAKNTPPADMAATCARVVLQRVRQNLRGAVTKIEKHLAAKANIAIQNSDDTEELFANVGTDATAKLEDERQMYEKIARKALANKMDIVNCVYRAVPINCGCKGKSKNTPAKDKKKKNSDDPYYADYYYGDKVYQRYQQFTGSTVFMEPGLRGARLRKKQHQQARLAEQVDTQRAFPGTQPVAAATTAASISKDKKKKNVEPLTRDIQSNIRNRSFPGVTRIASAANTPQWNHIPIEQLEKEMHVQDWEDTKTRARRPFPGVEAIASDTSATIPMPALKRVTETRTFPGVERIAKPLADESATGHRLSFPGVEPIASNATTTTTPMPGLKRVTPAKEFPGVERIANPVAKESATARRPAFPGVKTIASDASKTATTPVARIKDGRPDIFDF